MIRGSGQWHLVKALRVDSCRPDRYGSCCQPSTRRLLKRHRIMRQGDCATRCLALKVSQMELRLSLVAGRKGVTYVADLVTNISGDLVLIEGLRCSSVERQVGVDYLCQQPLSQAGTCFLASRRGLSNA